MDAFIADLRQKAKIDIYEDKLNKVLIDTGMNGSEGAGGPMAGMQPGAFGPHHDHPPMAPGVLPPGMSMPTAARCQPRTAVPAAGMSGTPPTAAAKTKP